MDFRTDGDVRLDDSTSAQMEKAVGMTALDQGSEALVAAMAGAAAAAGVAGMNHRREI